MINVAIVGAGIGKQHLTGYKTLRHIYTVSVICDLDTSRAAAAANGDDSIRIVRQIDDVMADPSIDIVDICLPPHLHVSTVIQALEAGKHAICEKPIARSVAEVEQMHMAMQRSKGRVFPVFQYRYGLGFSQLRALIEAGIAGRPLVASSETHWNRSAKYYSVPWRGTWKGEAGGAILGHAIHTHDLLCHIMGPVAEVSAYLDTLVNDIEVDDCASISMRMENGALVTSSVTLGAGNDTTRLRYCFAGLTAESGSAPYSPAEDTWTFIARGQTKQEDVDKIIRSVHQPRPGFSGFLEAVAEAISGQTGNEVSFEDGRRSIELVTAMYKSAREGCKAKLPIRSDSDLYNGWSPG